MQAGGGGAGEKGEDELQGGRAKSFHGYREDAVQQRGSPLWAQPASDHVTLVSMTQLPALFSNCWIHGSKIPEAGGRDWDYLKPPDIQPLTQDMFYKMKGSLTGSTANTYLKAVLKWQGLVKVHLFNAGVRLQHDSGNVSVPAKLCCGVKEYQWQRKVLFLDPVWFLGTGLWWPMCSSPGPRGRSSPCWEVLVSWWGEETSSAAGEWHVSSPVTFFQQNKSYGQWGHPPTLGRESGIPPEGWRAARKVW